MKKSELRQIIKEELQDLIEKYPAPAMNKGQKYPLGTIVKGLFGKTKGKSGVISNFEMSWGKPEYGITYTGGGEDWGVEGTSFDVVKLATKAQEKKAIAARDKKYDKDMQALKDKNAAADKANPKKDNFSEPSNDEKKKMEKIENKKIEADRKLELKLNKASGMPAKFLTMKTLTTGHWNDGHWFVDVRGAYWERKAILKRVVKVDIQWSNKQQDYVDKLGIRDITKEVPIDEMIKILQKKIKNKGK